MALGEEDVLFIPKGSSYDREQGLAARCSTWSQAQATIQDLLEGQRRGWVASNMKLSVWKSAVFDENTWCIKWVPKEMT